MRKRHTGIAVLEGKWWRGWNSSVRTTFDMIAEMTLHSSHAYHYEMANSLPALTEALPRIANDRTCRYLYLATHGDTESLRLFNGEVLRISHLTSLLSELPSGSKLHGLYLAACSVGSTRVATELFEANVRLVWIAGYQHEADWLPSSALDMLFFKELLYTSGRDEARVIEQVARRLRSLIPGLIEELGFGIFVRSRGKVINLLSDRA